MPCENRRSGKIFIGDNTQDLDEGLLLHAEEGSQFLWPEILRHTYVDREMERTKTPRSENGSTYEVCAMVERAYVYAGG